MNLTLNQYKKLILDKIDLIEVLHKVDPDAYYEEGRPCFCPFHDNQNTPAAAIYNDDDYMTLYCFSERKLYTSVDVLEKLLKLDPYMVGKKIWSKLGDSEKQEWLHNNESDKYISAFNECHEKSDSDNKLDRYKEEYKLGNISINDLFKAYIKK